MAHNFADALSENHLASLKALETAAIRDARGMAQPRSFDALTTFYARYKKLGPARVTAILNEHGSR